MAISAAAILAVSCVALATVVFRALPFHWTVAPLENPVPFTVSVSASAPATALEGERDLIVGEGELSPQPVSAKVKRMEMA